MKKRSSKIIAVILTFVMAFTPLTAVFAESSREQVSKNAKFVDTLLDTILDPLLGGIIGLLMKAESPFNRYPTADEFLSETQEYFYKGTDGEVTGTQWKMGYASTSVIPKEWRQDAEGNQDDKGMNLNKTYYFGGYFGSKVTKIYDDETVNLAVISAGTDTNKNGVEDIIIMATLDNIGMSNGNIRKVRKAAVEKLAQCGVTEGDIINFEFGCTHAHTVIEALGMSLDNVFFVANANHFFFKRDTSVKKGLLDAICENTADAVVKAYKGMEKGTLGFFETEALTDFMKENSVNMPEDGRQMAFDKLRYGADCQDTVACLYFESESGVKTILANAGMHPTFAGRSTSRVCADYPYYFGMAMKEQGYNLVFFQGSQAAVGVTGYYTQEGQNWAEKKELTRDEWVSRYGEEYTNEHYDEEKDYFEMKATAYSLAQAVVASVGEKQKVAPTINVKMDYVVIPFDYSILYLGGVSGAFGYNVVRTDSETGYGLATEIGYIKLGNILMLNLPGEVAPAITFGKTSKYTGEESWSGANSWSGEEWKYKTLKEMAQEKFGRGVKTIALGLANDEIAYVMPDTDCAKNFLTKSIVSEMGYHVGRANNEELMAASQNAGSAFVKGYANIFGVKAEKQTEN